MAGVFIVFEGGEGSGKSTQLALLAARLRESGHEVVVTREPGGSPRAEHIREILLDRGSAGMDPRCEALLFAAARADHAAEVIRPALQRGAVVISDRYLDSSVAYQGLARGLGEDRIRSLSRWATQDLVPDLTLVLDIDPRHGVARAQDANRLEAESMDFHDAVRAGFLGFAAGESESYSVIDADRPVAEVAADVADRVGQLIPGVTA